MDESVRNTEYFAGINWATLGEPRAGKYVDVRPSFDLQDSFDNANLTTLVDSPVFKQY